MSYIDTCNLDGETNLKIRNSIKLDLSAGPEDQVFIPYSCNPAEIFTIKHQILRGVKKRLTIGYFIYNILAERTIFGADTTLFLRTDTFEDQGIQRCMP